MNAFWSLTQSTALYPVITENYPISVFGLKGREYPEFGIGKYLAFLEIVPNYGVLIKE